MNAHQPTLAVYPGMFDPVTYGHLDIIKRGRRLFDKLIVAVGQDPDKQELFSQHDRVAMIAELVARMPNVEVRAYEGLTLNFVRSVGAMAILRGIRDSVDLRRELQLANTNLMVGDIETIFLMTTDQHALTSSTLIKQIASLGGYDPKRMARLVPPNVAEKLQEKFGRSESLHWDPLAGSTTSGSLGGGSEPSAP